MSGSNFPAGVTDAISRFADLAMQALIAGDAGALEALELRCAEAAAPVSASEMFTARRKLDSFRKFLDFAASNLRMLRRIPAGECDYRQQATGYVGTEARALIAGLAQVKGDSWGH